jgi:P27 family predicted phage terminase small subunit
MGGLGSGRRPKPAGLKLLEGARPDRDSGGRKVPVPRAAVKSGEPEPPERMHHDVVAMAVWLDVVDELEDLSARHGQIVACYCEAVSDYEAARAAMRKEGRYIANPKTGHRHPHPALADEKLARAAILAFGRELGLSPAGGPRVSPPGEPDPDDPIHGASNPFSPAGQLRRSVPDDWQEE